MERDLNRRSAIAFGIALPLLQACRTACFGRWPDSLAVWPIALDAYVTGAMLVAGAMLAARSSNRRLLAIGWGFSAGILYRSLFEHLADPTRHAGAEILVLSVKALLLVCAVAGLAGCVLRSPSAATDAAEAHGDHGIP
jgi:hypothetical protein